VSPAAFCILLLAAAFTQPSAERVLMYDEERGIVFVDKNEQDQQKQKPRQEHVAPMLPRQAPSAQKKGDIHVGRKKDPPDLYFKSGLQYFRNGDYLAALKNFTYARAADPQPQYFLWMGKTYRQLEQYDKMMSIMQEILKRYPESDVADDALFEIAFYYQKNDDYDRATEKYAE
jgi:tetratricopeptide (TPR) repeat protein